MLANSRKYKCYNRATGELGTTFMGQRSGNVRVTRLRAEIDFEIAVEIEGEKGYVSAMKNTKFIYWQDGSDWLGYLGEFPDYATQGSSLEDLKEHLKDLYTDLTGGQIQGVRHEGELVLA